MIDEKYELILPVNVDLLDGEGNVVGKQKSADVIEEFFGQLGDEVVDMIKDEEEDVDDFMAIARKLLVSPHDLQTLLVSQGLMKELRYSNFG